MHARGELSSLIAQSFKALALEDHVVLIIDRTGQSGKVLSTTSGACAISPSC
jgi:hypothetical protein